MVQISKMKHGALMRMKFEKTNDVKMIKMHLDAM